MGYNDMRAIMPITCPYCGAEYLPSELLVEDGILGDARGIAKTSDGKIVAYSGKPFDLHESYVCDFCGKGFEIDGTMSFVAYGVDDFDEEYERPLYQNRIELSEE